MQADHSEATSLATAQLRNSLQSMHEQEVQSLVSAFDSIHDQLRASNELVGVIYSRQNEVNDLLTKLDTSFASIESTATALQNTQRVDAEAQVRLQTQMQGELQVTQGLLADITASAVTLQATVQDAKSKIADMASYGGLPNVIMSWAWSLGILLVLYRFNPKVAGYAVTTLGESHDMAFVMIMFADNRSINCAHIDCGRASNPRAPVSVSPILRLDRDNAVGMDLLWPVLFVRSAGPKHPLSIVNTFSSSGDIDPLPCSILPSIRQAGRQRVTTQLQGLRRCPHTRCVGLFLS